MTFSQEPRIIFLQIQKNAKISKNKRKWSKVTLCICSFMLLTSAITYLFLSKNILLPSKQVETLHKLSNILTYSNFSVICYASDGDTVILYWLMIRFPDGSLLLGQFCSLTSFYIPMILYMFVKGADIAF